MFPQSPLKKMSLLCAAGFVTLPSAFSADVSWINPGTGLFGDGANWDSAAAPTDIDNAIIANGGTAQIQTDDVFTVNTLLIQSGTVTQSDAFLTTGITSSSWQTIGDLQIGGIAGQTGSLIVGGESVISTGRVRVGGSNVGGTDSADFHGSLTMTGGALTTAPGGGYDFWVGNGAGSTGVVNLSGSAEILVNSSMTSGRAGGDATVNLSGSSRLNATGFAYIGESGTADWTVSEGATLEIGGNLTISGGTTNSLTVQDTATVSVGGELQIGNGSGSVGNVVFSGGMLTANSWTGVGRQSGTGDLTMSGDALLIKTSGTTMQIGDGAGAVGTVSLSDNARIESASRLRLGLGGTGTLTLSGTSSVELTGTGVDGNLEVGESNGTGTLNLNGGTLTAAAITKFAGATATLSFNGGTLRATAANSDFLTGFQGSDLTIQSGGLKFDTNGNAIGITQALAGEGGLTKLGAGTLTLSGVNTFTGFSSIEAGTLAVAVGGDLEGVINLGIASGAALDLAETISLNDNIVLFLVSGSTLTLNFSGTSTVAALWINGSPIDPGEYTLAELSALAGGAIFDGNSAAILDVTSTVPEPATSALLACGAACAVLRMRRRV